MEKTTRKRLKDRDKIKIRHEAEAKQAREEHEKFKEDLKDWDNAIFDGLDDNCKEDKEQVL